LQRTAHDEQRITNDEKQNQEHELTTQQPGAAKQGFATRAIHVGQEPEPAP
jgi:hypothetical protein